MLAVLTGIITVTNLPASSAGGAEKIASSAEIWMWRQQPHASILAMTVFTHVGETFVLRHSSLLSGQF